MNAARILIYSAFFVLIAYDVIAEIWRLPTISAEVRRIDAQSGSLLRWLLVALMFHWFLPLPWGGWHS